MMLRGSVTGVLVGAFLALRALAFADPPDPSWIAGFWDDDDYDDVVILVTSTCGVVESDPCVHPGPIRISAALVVYPEEGPSPTRVPNSHRPRDPPAA